VEEYSPNVSATAGSADGPRGWMVTAAAAIGLFVSAPSIWLFTSGVFLLPLTAELHVSRGQTAAALAIFPLCVALAAPAAGYLVDRVGGPLVARVSVLLFAIALTSIASAPANYAAFAAIVAFAGLISAGQTAIPYCRVVSGWFDRRRGLALSVALTGVGIGAAAFPVVAQHMIGAHGWRAAMLSIAATALVIAFPAVALLLRDPPKGGSRTASVAATSGMTRAQAFRDRQFWLIAAAFILIGGGTAGVPVHFPALLHDRGVAPGLAAALLSAIGISLIFGRLFTGWLLDRMHAGRVGFILFALSAAGVALLATTASPPLLLLGAITVGLATGAEYDLMAFLVTRYFGFRHFGTLFGALTLFFSVGAAAGPALVGAAFDRTGGYFVGYLALAAALLTASVCLLNLGRYPVAQSRAPSPPAAVPVPALGAAVGSERVS
jgi:MFS family permease